MRARRERRSVEGVHGVHEAGAGPGRVPPAAADAWPAPAGAFVNLEGEDWYRIAAFDELPPFLVNLPTDTDLWMFISSSGGLTAGRRDPDGALFPYETVDKLHEGHTHTGPVTHVRVRRAGREAVAWTPFAPLDAPGRIERSLAKNVTGNRIRFEEVHHGLGLAFAYRWAGSDATGWVRTASLVNVGRESLRLEVLDGLRNVLPGGVPVALTQQASCLVDAYKRADLDPATGLATYALTARVSDGPEPAEVLRANTVWCHGLPAPTYALSLDAVRAFRRGRPVAGERVLTGRRAAFLAVASLRLEPGQRIEWHLAADAARSHVQVERLRAQLAHRDDLALWVEDCLRRASRGLERIVASSDGLQLTARREVTVHHFANALFNDLRGGVFLQDHTVPGPDVAAFVRARDRRVAERHADLLGGLTGDLQVAELHRLAAARGDADLRRLAYEYLPLYFGRRHGDPSRPWNRFSIRVREDDGRQALRYEGNWRDIFQNWEALTRSFPDFLPGVVAKFVNASTLDGFNPYRIGRDGIDWEVHDPDDPWSGIGYWGDHQIVYLLRLLESTRAHVPGALEELLGEPVFSYADVPYRLAGHDAMVREPRATVRFDDALAAGIAERVVAVGEDGRLVPGPGGGVLHVTLLEKLLVPALAKLSCLVPDGGVWLNTQRPEWNDANNALVGGGLSVVTVCHLRRYLRFVDDLLGAPGVPASVAVSPEVTAWLRAVAAAFAEHRRALDAPRFDDASRRRLFDALGRAFEAYRERVYVHRLSAPAPLATEEVRAAFRLACEHVDHAIRANRREDGLYHSYNLLEAGSGGGRATVHPLEIMLEGQVAALSSGLVTPREAVAMLDALFASPLHRPDQDSFMLYPVRTLPTFLERNRVPEARALALPLVQRLLAVGDDTILDRDAAGTLRFAGDFANARDLTAALDRRAADPAWTELVARDREALVALFVEVFEHRTFTGRSGRMYAYEGIGCVYWHMVAKLLLAVQEIALEARDRGEPADVLAALAHGYRRVRRGLGYEKSVAAYGAFPADPYSHTPAHAGAQQPGMTGQVKEELLTRAGELGLRVRDGLVGFEPWLLERAEFLARPAVFRFHGLGGAARSLDVPAGSLAFTCCQVPVVYTLVRGAAWIRVTGDDGAHAERAGACLDAAESRRVLGRLGGIARIEVGVPEDALAP